VAKWWWVVKVTSQLLYPRERSGIQCSTDKVKYAVIFLLFCVYLTILALSTRHSPPYYLIYVPNFASKCCHNFTLYEIKPIDIFSLPFNKGEFIIKIGFKETESIEKEQYDENRNGRKEQGNVFTAIFLTLRRARIQ
jgi:hypothetical protein